MHGSQRAEAVDDLQVVERGLAEHPVFGNSYYIRAQLEQVFRRRLTKVGAHVPKARELLDALDRSGEEIRYRTIGDTVLRCAIKYAHAQVETGEPGGFPLKTCERLFETAIAHLDSRDPGSLLSKGEPALQRIGTRAWHGWIWDEARDADLYERSFRYVVKENSLPALAAIDDKDVAAARRGQALLEALLPALGASAAGHAHTIGIFRPEGRWSSTASSSQFRVSGTIFISRAMLWNPWKLAEHLFHESLHQKLYDFRSGHKMLAESFEEQNPPRVRSLWNLPGLNDENLWNTHRAMAAFHVYVHLALLGLVAERRSHVLENEYGPMEGMISSRNALDRAQHLGLQLRDKCSDELDYGGHRLLEWLMSIVDILEYDHSRKGARSHLLLDRSRKEAKKIESICAECETARSTLAPPLGALAADEISRVRDVLGALKGEKAAEDFARAAGEFDIEQLGARFADVRELIARTLLGKFGGGDGIGMHGLDQDGRIEDMVQRGSERLAPLLLGLSPALVEAKRRAHRLPFNQSCKDDVGKVLAVLAAAVPPNGRILEIGTGVGVGVAWIAMGLRQRTDVEVVSIEADIMRSESAQTYSWPTYVRLMTGDALDLLPQLGAFDLVFADANPIKYSGIETILSSLRVRGTLLVDDLNRSSRSAEPAHDEAKLRTYLSRHPDLQTVYLDWSTGIVLAVRNR